MPGVISCVTRARSGAPPRTQPQKRHARVLSTRRDASRDPFALKRCVLMRHLKTLGRATNLSSIKMHCIERHPGRQWRIHPPSTHARKNSTCLLWPRQNASLDPFVLKTCSQHTAPPRARASLGRASNLSPIKNQNASCRAPHRS